MNNEPLANALRPKKLSDVIGQEHLIGKDKILTNLVKNKKIFSLILYVLQVLVKHLLQTL